MSGGRSHDRTGSWMDEQLTLRGLAQVLAITTAVIFIPFAIAATHAWDVQPSGSEISRHDLAVAFTWTYTAFQTLICASLLLLYRLVDGRGSIPDWMLEGAGLASLGSLAQLLVVAAVRLGLGWWEADPESPDRRRFVPGTERRVAEGTAGDDAAPVERAIDRTDSDSRHATLELRARLAAMLPTVPVVVPSAEPGRRSSCGAATSRRFSAGGPRYRAHMGPFRHLRPVPCVIRPRDRQCARVWLSLGKGRAAIPR